MSYGTLILIGIAATAVTALGGWLALRLRDRLHLIIGFSAGAVLGVAFFDLLPEAFSLAGGRDPAATGALLGCGFLIYLLVDRMLSMHAGHGHGDPDEAHAGAHRGTLGAAALSIHSFLDGLAIGFSFQVSAAVGAIVTIAVLTHDFSDGINTVNLSLMGGSERRARWWLLADALAPLLGIGATFLVRVQETALGILIALFCGFFLYIGAAELVPESHHRHPHLWTTAMTVLGMAVLFAAIRLASA
ncbi:MAG TPA: ZIP family metal transporter [Candidatus Paceibacterota bacterium]|nr:ZIP family metal transporter [Candidatus Paceibacterota bacterium]